MLRATLALKPHQGAIGNHQQPSLLQVSLWSRTLLGCGGQRRTSGNLSPNTRPTMSQTNRRLSYSKAAINDTRVTNHFKTKGASIKLEKKVGVQMGDSRLTADTINKHLEKVANDAPKSQELNSTNNEEIPGMTIVGLKATGNIKAKVQKADTAGLTKNTTIAAAEPTITKSWPSIRLNKEQPSIKQDKVQVRFKVGDEIRDDIHTCFRVNKRVYTRDNRYAKARVNVRADSSYWDPGGTCETMRLPPRDLEGIMTHAKPT